MPRAPHRNWSIRRKPTHRISRLAAEALEPRTLLDASGARILAHTPQVQNGAFVNLDVTFDEPIDPPSFTTEDVNIQGPAGAIAATEVSPITGHTYRISFSPLTAQGTYRAAIGPQITDTDGNS